MEVVIVALVGLTVHAVWGGFQVVGYALWLLWSGLRWSMRLARLRRRVKAS
jgi:uncharacterized membrane protein